MTAASHPPGHSQVIPFSFVGPRTDGEEGAPLSRSPPRPSTGLPPARAPVRAARRRRTTPPTPREMSEFTRRPVRLPTPRDAARLVTPRRRSSRSSSRGAGRLARRAGEGGGASGRGGRARRRSAAGRSGAASGRAGRALVASDAWARPGMRAEARSRAGARSGCSGRGGLQGAVMTGRERATGSRGVFSPPPCRASQTVRQNPVRGPCGSRSPRGAVATMFGM